MRAKIQRTLVLILTITLLVSYLLFSFIVYRQNLSILKSDVRQEASYIRTALEVSGAQYLEQLDSAGAQTRITYIDQDGNVLYDSQGGEASLENHKERKEIREALEKGSGEDIRMSDTVGAELYYYAIRMQNGNVLRVAKTRDSLAGTALQILPLVAFLGLFMILLAYVISRHQTNRLIRPINELDIAHPLDNNVYEELAPLLTEIDRHNKEKEKTVTMRKEFSANVSHELKTPLTSISGYAEIMKNGLVRPEDMHIFAERIYKEAKRLITLVEDIIKLSKLDEESVELEKENVEMYELCREVLGRLMMQAEEKNVTLQLDGEPVVYCGIRQIMDEMIYNLCENAVKYNVDGGRVILQVGRTEDGVKITVTDTGIGIPAEHLGRIFERFYRVDKSHSKETGGTGLGLSIVKHGALLHDAKVEVQSEVGKGTRIILLF